MSGTEIAAMLVLGGMAGILSGMFGIGGGLVIVPTLIVIFELDPKTAVGTSLFAPALADGLARRSRILAAGRDEAGPRPPDRRWGCFAGPTSVRGSPGACPRPP